jgi:hypothetical protein
MCVSFEARFGFDAIFSAIGFSGVVDVVVVGFDAGAAWVEVDVGLDLVEPCGVFAPDVAIVGLPAADFVGFTLVVGLTAGAVVGFPVLCVLCVVVDIVGLPAVVGLPLVVGFPLVVGLPTVVGFPALVGLTGFGAWLTGAANAGDSVRDAAATKPRIVDDARIRGTSKGLSLRKGDATHTGLFLAEIH